MDEEALYAARVELVDFLIEAFWDTPSDAFVESLLADDVRVPEDEINPKIDDGFDRLTTYLSTINDRSVEIIVDELSTEYTRLFVGPRPPILAHETYYRDDTEFIGKGLAAVESSYAAAGWSPPDWYGEENDFIAVELAFLRNLIQRQGSGEAEAYKYERIFLDEHLQPWTGDFVADVHDESDHAFFLAAADILVGFLDFEDGLVAQVIPD